MIYIASFFSGICASLGIGGGFILLLYLTLVLEIEQKEAQLLNLIFFIPIAIISIIMHKKNNIIEFDKASPCIVGGVIGVMVAIFINTFITSALLSKIFGVFLIIFGAKALFTKNKGT